MDSEHFESIIRKVALDRLCTLFFGRSNYGPENRRGMFLDDMYLDKYIGFPTKALSTYSHRYNFPADHPIGLPTAQNPTNYETDLEEGEVEDDQPSRSNRRNVICPKMVPTDGRNIPAVTQTDVVPAVVFSVCLSANGMLSDTCEMYVTHIRTPYHVTHQQAKYILEKKYNSDNQLQALFHASRDIITMDLRLISSMLEHFQKPGSVNFVRWTTNLLGNSDKVKIGQVKAIVEGCSAIASVIGARFCTKNYVPCIYHGRATRNEQMYYSTEIISHGSKNFDIRRTWLYGSLPLTNQIRNVASFINLCNITKWLRTNGDRTARRNALWFTAQDMHQGTREKIRIPASSKLLLC